MSTNFGLCNGPDIISLEELREDRETTYDQFEIAGIDPLTPVDTFLRMQGSTAFITGDPDEYNFKS